MKKINTCDRIETFEEKFLKDDYMKHFIGGFNMKDYMVLLRCTKEEKALLKGDAKKHKKDVSAYLRWLIDKQRKEDERNEKLD